MGNNPETNGDICSQEYSGIIFLILKKKKKTLVKRKRLAKIILTNKKNPENI